MHIHYSSENVRLKIVDTEGTVVVDVQSGNYSVDIEVEALASAGLAAIEAIMARAAVTKASAQRHDAEARELEAKIDDAIDRARAAVAEGQAG